MRNCTRGAGSCLSSLMTWSLERPLGGSCDAAEKTEPKQKSAIKAHIPRAPRIDLPDQTKDKDRTKKIRIGVPQQDGAEPVGQHERIDQRIVSSPSKSRQR